MAKTDTDADWRFIQTLRQERVQLAEQIRQSQDTIDRSRELLKKIDEILERAANKQ